MPVAHERNDSEGWEGTFFQFEAADPEYVLMIQRALEPAEPSDEGASDLDKVCVSYFGASQYGCIIGWEQPAVDEIRMTITPEAATALHLDEVTEFTVDDVDDLTEAFDQVKRMLAATGELA